MPQKRMPERFSNPQALQTKTPPASRSSYMNNCCNHKAFWDEMRAVAAGCTGNLPWQRRLQSLLASDRDHRSMFACFITISLYVERKTIPRARQD